MNSMQFLMTIILSLNIISNNDNIMPKILESINYWREFYNYQKIIELYDHIPMDDDHIVYLVNCCYEYSVDPDLILAVIWTESQFNPKAKNKHSSARGYGQFIKSTANSIANAIPEIKDYKHHIDAHNPYISIKMTIHYLSECLNRHGGNINKALQRYRGCNDQKYFKLIAQRRSHIKKNKAR